jgi:hypothetical protein
VAFEVGDVVHVDPSVEIGASEAFKRRVRYPMYVIMDIRITPSSTHVTIARLPSLDQKLYLLDYEVREGVRV